MADDTVFAEFKGSLGARKESWSAPSGLFHVEHIS